MNVPRSEREVLDGDDVGADADVRPPRVDARGDADVRGYEDVGVLPARADEDVCGNGSEDVNVLNLWLHCWLVWDDEDGNVHVLLSDRHIPWSQFDRCDGLLRIAIDIQHLCPIDRAEFLNTPRAHQHLPMPPNTYPQQFQSGTLNKQFS